MATFLITFLVFAILIAAMAVGVILGRKPIQGTCGGMAALGMGTSCDICGGDPNLCKEENENVSAVSDSEKNAHLSYDATNPSKDK